MNSIFVTGGSGLIGANLCRKLLRDGERVVAVDNFITSDGSNLKDLTSNPNFKFIRHDICKKFDAKIQNLKVKTIYHLACPTGVPNLVKLAYEMLMTCSIGTRNILEFAVNKNANFIFTSSSEVYGDPKEFPQKETYTGNVDSTGVRSPYEEGKRFSESLIASYIRKYTLNAKIVRVFNTYGPGAAPTETRVITKFLRAAKKGLDLTVEGDGKQTRTFCYVDDLIEALIKVSQKGKAGEAYNAGGENEVSVRELAELILNITGAKSNIKFVSRPNHDHTRRLPDLTKIKSLGWHQTTGIYEGLNKTLAGDLESKVYNFKQL